MILVIDNYDSFTYNIVQTAGLFTQEIKVARNDKISIEDIFNINPDRIIISPGPGNPSQAGISLDVIKNFSGQIPILGVCLGHQCIAQAFGGKIIKAPVPIHGKTAEIFHDGKGIFSGIKTPFTATRYHSLIVEKDSFPDELVISAWTKDGLIMALRHKKFFLEGVQFHPESFLTAEGKKLVGNFLR